MIGPFVRISMGAVPPMTSITIEPSRRLAILWKRIAVAQGLLPAGPGARLKTSVVPGERSCIDARRSVVLGRDEIAATRVDLCLRRFAVEAVDVTYGSHGNDSGASPPNAPGNASIKDASCFSPVCRKVAVLTIKSVVR
jgi:hypothetical protein